MGTELPKFSKNDSLVGLIIEYRSAIGCFKIDFLKSISMERAEKSKCEYNGANVNFTGLENLLESC